MKSKSPSMEYFWRDLGAIMLGFIWALILLGGIFGIGMWIIIHYGL